MDFSTYLTFCIACFALAVVPGPTVTVLVANGLRYGFRAALLGVLGTVAAGIVWVIVASLGLSAAVASMGVWFDALRYSGAAYLVWLGLGLLRKRGSLIEGKAAAPNTNFFWQAFLVLMANPKILVLYGMMIPPFLSGKAENVAIETLFLGGTFIVIAAITDLFWAYASSKAGNALSQSRVRGIEIVSGLFLTAGGVWMALRGR